MLNLIRALWRRIFSPNGLWWFVLVPPSIEFIMALHSCSRDEAEAMQQSLIDFRLERWRAGEKF
jgi:hypothetical protein